MAVLFRHTYNRIAVLLYFPSFFDITTGKLCAIGALRTALAFFLGRENTEVSHEVQHNEAPHTAQPDVHDSAVGDAIEHEQLKTPRAARRNSKKLN